MRGLCKTKNDTGNGKKRQIQETLQKHGRKKNTELELKMAENDRMI